MPAARHPFPVHRGRAQPTRQTSLFHLHTPTPVGCSKSTPTSAWAGGFADITCISAAAIPSLSSLNYDLGIDDVVFPWLGGNLQSGMSHEDGMAMDVVVTPLGYDDEGTKKPSWNGAGTAEAPPPGTHQTCYDPTHSFATCAIRAAAAQGEAATTIRARGRPVRIRSRRRRGCWTSLSGVSALTLAESSPPASPTVVSSCMS